MTGRGMSFFDRFRRFFGGGSPAARGPAPDAAGSGEGPAMTTCEEALRLVHDFLDGELEGATAEEVRHHFEVCQRCYPHLHLETAFREAIRRASAGPGAPAELKKRVSLLLAEARADD